MTDLWGASDCLVPDWDDGAGAVPIPAKDTHDQYNTVKRCAGIRVTGPALSDWENLPAPDTPPLRLNISRQLLRVRPPVGASHPA